MGAVSPVSSVTTAITSVTPAELSALATTSRYMPLTATIRARESAEDLRDAVGPQHGRDRHRHSADPHGREIGDHELRRVRHDHDDTLLGLQPQAA